MDSTSSVSLFEADFDKSQLPPIEQKRLVAFVNHFLIDTTKFLNTFIVNCEERFVTLESKLQKINAELVVIESKIFQGELKNPLQVERTSEGNKDEVDENASDERLIIDDAQSSNPTSTEDGDVDVKPIEEDTGVKVCDDVRYEKYFKMKQFGVPAQAVKLKMSAEGLDSSLLDQPDRILEDGIKRETVEETE